MPNFPCQICHQKAHGTHFGAISCRACSAFFRRSIIDKNADSFKCIRGDDSCQVIFFGKFYCKKCRLRKCYKVGMDPKYFQHNRDKIKPLSTTPYQIPSSMSTFIGRPAHIIHCTTPNTTKNSVINVSSLIEKATELMNFGPIFPEFSGNLGILEKMSLAGNWMNFEKIENLEKVKLLDKTFFLVNWEVEFLKNAKWLCQFDEFHRLPGMVKLQLLMVTWHIRARMDRLVQTARFRKSEKIGKYEFMITKGSAMDLRNCELDVSWCTDFKNEEIAFFLENSDAWVHNELVKYLEDLSPTDIEVSFMTCQLCFHYAGKRIQGDILDTMDHFLDVISNELHNYYQLNSVNNYSERVAKMMKINNMIQKVIWEKRWKTELAKKFDIFHVEFSHPEMFYDCC